MDLTMKNRPANLRETRLYILALIFIFQSSVNSVEFLGRDINWDGGAILSATEVEAQSAKGEALEVSHLQENAEKVILEIVRPGNPENKESKRLLLGVNFKSRNGFILFGKEMRRGKLPEHQIHCIKTAFLKQALSPFKESSTATVVGRVLHTHGFYYQISIPEQKEKSLLWGRVVNIEGENPIIEGGYCLIGILTNESRSWANLDVDPMKTDNLIEIGFAIP